MKVALQNVPKQKLFLTSANCIISIYGQNLRKYNAPLLDYLLLILPPPPWKEMEGSLNYFKFNPIGTLTNK